MCLCEDIPPKLVFEYNVLHSIVSLFNYFFLNTFILRLPRCFTCDSFPLTYIYIYTSYFELFRILCRFVILSFYHFIRLTHSSVECLYILYDFHIHLYIKIFQYLFIHSSLFSPYPYLYLLKHI